MEDMKQSRKRYHVNVWAEDREGATCVTTVWAASSYDAVVEVLLREGVTFAYSVLVWPAGASLEDVGAREWYDAVLVDPVSGRWTAGGAVPMVSQDIRSVRQQECDYLPERDGPYPTESSRLWAENHFFGQYPDLSYNPRKPHGSECCCTVCDPSYYPDES